MSGEESDDDDDGRVMGGQGAGLHSNCEQYFKLNLIISASSPLAGRNSWGMLRSELLSLSRHFGFYCDISTFSIILLYYRNFG